MERRSPILYQVIPGSSVMVDTKSHPGKFAWARVKSIIYAVKFAAENLPPHYFDRTQPSMQLYLAMNAFNLTGYNYHPDTVGHYESGTFFFAYPNREGGVSRVLKEDMPDIEPKWTQGSFPL